MSPSTMHRYSCGQHVSISDRRDLGASWGGGFRVTEVVPLVETVQRYWVESMGGTIRRLVDEQQLSALVTISLIL